jgi:hypothetical protein
MSLRKTRVNTQFEQKRRFRDGNGAFFMGRHDKIPQNTTVENGSCLRDQGHNPFQIRNISLILSSSFSGSIYIVGEHTASGRTDIIHLFVTDF